jgi:hypothetical protein
MFEYFKFSMAVTREKSLLSEVNKVNAITLLDKKATGRPGPHFIIEVYRIGSKNLVVRISDMHNILFFSIQI